MFPQVWTEKENYVSPKYCLASYFKIENAEEQEKVGSSR